MVLPSGGTRVSSLPKGSLLSPSSVGFDRFSQAGNAGKTPMMGNDDIADNLPVFKQTDVGSTDPRLVRKITGRNQEEFHLSNEALNNFSTDLASKSRETDVGRASDFRGSDQVNRSASLAGRFARACLLHDTSLLDGGYNVFQNNCEVINKTSVNKMRCSSNVSSDGQESCLSVLSGLETPTEDSRSGSFADCNDIFPDVSDMSLSVEEQTSTSQSELDSVVRSPAIVSDCVTRDFPKNDYLCGEAKNPTKDFLLVRKTPEDVCGDFDVYNIETTLPYMNWDYLEEQLQKAIEKEEMSQTQRNDREKIRQKLAMGLDDDHYAAGDRLFKKPSLQARLHSAMNLQMCFVNEASSDIAESGSDVGQLERTISKDICSMPKELSSNSLLRSVSSLNSLASSKPCPQSVTMSTIVSSSVGSGITSQEELDFFARQARLQAEARLALAQVRPMAHMQLQLEKQLRRKSPIADIVGIPGFGDGKNGHLTCQLLKRMNLGQLQVVVNDMHAQIEAFNTELMELLIERDDLHMAQDSMLVDIEDLTRRAQEYDLRMKSKLVGNQGSC